MSRVSQTITRPARTGAQMTTSAAIVEAVDAFGLVDFDGRQYAVTVVLLGLVIGFIQVLLENRGVIPAVGRNVPPIKAPVVDRTLTDDVSPEESV